MKSVLRSNPARASLLLSLAFVAGAAPASAQAWLTRPDIPAAKHGHSAAVGEEASGEKLIYTFGGSEGASLTNTVRAYNRLGGGSWSTVAPMPGVRKETAAVTAKNGLGEERIYVFGGTDGTAVATTTCWAYDPLNDVWETGLAPMPAPRRYFSAALGDDGLIYVFGGLDTSFAAKSTVMVYDPANDDWLPNAPSMPLARWQHVAVAACDGFIYMMGGQNGPNEVGAVHVFDPGTGWLGSNPHAGFAAWAPMPTPRTDLGAAVARDGRIYTLGGQGNGSPIELDTHESFHPYTNTWAFETPMPTARYDFPAVAVGARVYAVSGDRKNPPPTPSLEAFGTLPQLTSCVGLVPVHPPAPFGSLFSCQVALPVLELPFIPELVVTDFEEDWYEVALAPGHELSVTLDYLVSEGDVDLFLYDQCGGQAIGSSTGQTGRETLSFSNMSGFTRPLFVQVRVSNAAQSGALYDFEMLVDTIAPLGTIYCSPASSNSTGLPARITATGSDVAADNDFWLSADGLPTNQFGYFLASKTQGFVQNPGGSQGNLCVVGGIGRFNQQIQHSGTTGSFGIQVDLAHIPTTPVASVVAGETWSFQGWYRDLNPTPTSNFTDAVEVSFQ